METPLVTSDGFPRDDIDVAQIREARSRIIRLKNDLRGIMSKIEAGLVEYFKNAKNYESESPISTTSRTTTTHTTTASTTATTATAPTPAPQLPIPFAVVNSVEPNSPAESAGLISGDLIVSFGTVNVTNHQNLARIANIVQINEGVSVVVFASGGRALPGPVVLAVRAVANLWQKHIWVTVLRDGNKVIMPLIPSQTWGGRGSLGCHIVPYE